MSELDLTDSAVRSMAERNHGPEEHWGMAGELRFVLCEKCGQQWPCGTILRLRAMSNV